MRSTVMHKIAMTQSVYERIIERHKKPYRYLQGYIDPDTLRKSLDITLEIFPNTIRAVIQRAISEYLASLEKR